MNLHQQLRTKVSQSFLNALLPDRSKFALRPGYFYVKAINYKSIGLHGQIAMAQVNWKQDINSAFLEDLIFDVALSSLHSRPPQEVEPVFYTDLIGKVIYVHQPSLEKRMIEGNERDVLRCKWDFVDGKPKFIAEQNAAVFAFGGSAITLSEAYQNFITTAKYDVLVTEENESLYGFKDNSLIEGWAENYDELVEDVATDSLVEDLPDDEGDEKDNPKNPSN